MQVYGFKHSPPTPAECGGEITPFRYVEVNHYYGEVVVRRIAGTKTITLPAQTDVIDMYTPKVIGRNIDHFQFDMGAFETRNFLCGNADAILEQLK